MVRAQNCQETACGHTKSQLTVVRKMLRLPKAPPAGPIDVMHDKTASWTVRRRVAALLRKAFRVVFMGRQRALGRLSGGGAAVTALLMSMGLILATPASAQYVSGTGATSNVVGTSTTSSVSSATSVGSIAIGGGTAAADKATVAANSLDAIAIGAGATATGSNTTVIGQTSTATSITLVGGAIIPAIAIGANSKATATNTASGILDRTIAAGTTTIATVSSGT